MCVPAIRSIWKLIPVSICILLAAFFIPKSYADISSCSASVSPTSLAASSYETFTFSVNNEGASSAVWVQIEAPTSDYGISAASTDGGWSNQSNSLRATFTNGSLGSNSSDNFYITIGSGPLSTDPTQFVVKISDQPDGSNAVTCGGTHQISITGEQQNNNDPLEISNVSISNISNSSVTISFDTNRDATSEIDYTSDYGDESDTISSATSHHTYVLQNLHTNTTYRYTLNASDTNNISTSTDESSFTTALSVAATSTPGPTSTPIIRTTTNTITLPTPTPLPDKQVPVVTVDQPANQPYKDVPVIKGTAVDNTQVSTVEYSLDNGKTWSRIKNVNGLNTSTADFSLTPDLPEGKDTFGIRAKDNSGNISKTVSISITIDKTGPKILTATDLTHPFAATTAISGTASDPSGESTVEYSLDAGASWIPVDQSETKNATDVSFTFTPSLQDDGNYPILIRAKDPLGNISQNTSLVLIIDRLPPRAGGFFLSIGPQILPSDGSGFTTLPGIPHSFTISLAGGPVQASINTNSQTIQLHRIGSTKLWSTDITFSSSGEFPLMIQAVDGAKNSLQKQLTTVHVMSPGQIKGPTNIPVAATVKLYVKDSLSGDFILWDGAAYGQENPQKTDANGVFAFYPPSGTYYISIERGFGYSAVITNSFTTMAGQPVSPLLTLPLPPHISVFGMSIPIPSLFHQSISFFLPNTEHKTTTSNTNQLTVPESTLSTIDPSRTFAGKKTLLVFMNTWMPQTPAQIEILEQIHQSDPDKPILVIFPHESKAAVELYAKRGDYTIPMRADPDGDLLEFLTYESIPTIYSLDTSLHVTDIQHGIQSAETVNNL